MLSCDKSFLCPWPLERWGRSAGVAAAPAWWIQPIYCSCWCVDTIALKLCLSKTSPLCLPSASIRFLRLVARAVLETGLVTVKIQPASSVSCLMYSQSSLCPEPQLSKSSSEHFFAWQYLASLFCLNLVVSLCILEGMLMSRFRHICLAVSQKNSSWIPQNRT